MVVQLPGQRRYDETLLIGDIGGALPQPIAEHQFANQGDLDPPPKATISSTNAPAKPISQGLRTICSPLLRSGYWQAGRQSPTYLLFSLKVVGPPNRLFDNQG